MAENCVSFGVALGFWALNEAVKKGNQAPWIKGVPSVEVGSLTFFSHLLLVLVRSGVAQSALDAVATIAVATMLFWATGDFASVALRFYSFSEATGNVLDRCDNLLRQRKELMQKAVTVLDEYNCFVLHAPPIPTIVYKWRQNMLNDAWRKRKDSKANAI